MPAKYRVPVLLSDDTHAALQLGWYYEQATALAQQAGITNFVYPAKVVSYTSQQVYTDWLYQNTC